MKKDTYIIRITVADSIYTDYMVDAENLFFAKIKARNAYFRDNPNSSKNIKMSLLNPDTAKIREIVNIIREAN